MYDEPTSLDKVAARLGLSRFDIAQILDATPGIVDAWLSGAMAPGPISRRKLNELLEVLEVLFDKLSPTAARTWLTLPNAALDYYEPVDLLRRGDLSSVMKTLEAIPRASRLDGSFSELVGYRISA